MTQRVRRIIREIQDFFKDPPKNIHIVPDSQDIGTLYVLIRGPDRTPYSNAFFFIKVRFPETYPWSPPVLTLMTTGNGTCSLHPMFQTNGEIHVNILYKEWAPPLTISKVLLSVQSLLGPTPYFFPGNSYIMNEENRQNSDKYNDWLIYSTLQVAVIGMLDHNSSDTKDMPQELKEIMISFFRNNYFFYENLVILEMKFIDFAQFNLGYDYRGLLEDLLRLKKLYRVRDTTDYSLPQIWSQTRASSEPLPSYQAKEPMVESYKVVTEKVLSTIPVSENPIYQVYDDVKPDVYEEDDTSDDTLMMNVVDDILDQLDDVCSITPNTRLIEKKCHNMSITETQINHIPSQPTNPDNNQTTSDSESDSNSSDFDAELLDLSSDDWELIDED